LGQGDDGNEVCSLPWLARSSAAERLPHARRSRLRRPLGRVRGGGLFPASGEGSTSNVADEGFVWYGCILTAGSKIPLRDFYSYDPGRYYWVAAFSPWLGQGILAMRIATAAFQALGLFCAS